MFPELFQFNLPDFFYNFFSIKSITIYSYPLCIFLGSVIAYHYFQYAQKKYIGKKHLGIGLLIVMIVMAYIGGKVFLILNNISKNNIENYGANFYTSGGFVFYGSFLFCIISFLIILDKKKLPKYKYLDLIAIVASIVHPIGRLGCFLAGCCYGKTTNSVFGVFFQNNLQNRVYPTQLFESFFISVLLIFLIRLQNSKKNDGIVFVTYVLAYATLRFFLEFLRGDNRGYVFNNLISHSQLIALILIITLVSSAIYKIYKAKIT